MKNTFNWKQLSRRLETLLQENHDPVLMLNSQAADLQMDLSNLSHELHKAPADPVERVLHVFSKMMNYFEAGLLFENMDRNDATVALFHNRQMQVAPDSFHELKIKLPSTQNFQVLTTSSQVFMKKLKLNWDPDNRMRAFLIRPTKDFTVVLFSPVPDLWMQTEIPKLVHFFEKFFSHE